MMVSALCHDLDHPGNDNAFEVKTGSDLALLYNDISVRTSVQGARAFYTGLRWKNACNSCSQHIYLQVLENHHAAMTFRILKGSC